MTSTLYGEGAAEGNLGTLHSSLFTLGTTTPSFTPSNLTNGVEWWNAADTASITQSSNAVSQINGQQGVYNMAMATAAKQPITNTTTINGHNVLVFDNVDDTLIASPITSINQPYTMWFAGKLVSNTGSRHDGVGPLIFTNLILADSCWQMFAGSASTSGIVTDLNVHLVIAVYDGASTKMYVDGTTSGAMNPGTNATGTGLQMGDNGGGNPANMQMGSCGVTSGSMSAGDRASMRTWAQTFWGSP